MPSFLLLALIFGIESGAQAEDLHTATFACGCFWCMEPPFERLDGVITVESGYTGGQKANPTYEEVSSGRSGHLEAVRIRFNPKKISYESLLEVFWAQIDPTDAEGQFVDRGAQYGSAIFFHDPAQKAAAEASKAALEKANRYGGKKIVTRILPVDRFYLAEDYHQDFSSKNPIRYKNYRSHSGRDQFLERVWGKKTR